MSPPEEYVVDVPLTIISPKAWRSRPEMFLGTARESWRRIVLERAIAELGSPCRSWTKASLVVEGRAFGWTDDSSIPVSESNVFWRDACSGLKIRTSASGTEAEFSLDEAIPVPDDEGLFRVVQRCSARNAGAGIRVDLDQRLGMYVSSSWREYASGGELALDFTSRMCGPFQVEFAIVDAPSSELMVELLEKGIPSSSCQEWMRIHKHRFEGRGLRVVLHTEVTYETDQLEDAAVAVLRQVLQP